MRKLTPLSEPAKALFLTTFQVSPNWTFPERFEPADYLGMYLCQRLRGQAGTDLLLIWWDDRDSYSSYWRDRLSKDLGITATSQFEGGLIERRPKVRRWWTAPETFFPWGLTFIASVVALIGNFSQLESYGSWLWAAPKAEISVSALPLRCVQNEERVVEFKIHNRSTGTCTLTDLKAVADTPHVLIIDPQLGPLAPLQSGEVRIVGCQILPRIAGTHRITFSGEIRAGRLREKAALSTAALQLDVWAPFDQAPKIILEHSNGNEANFLIEARHGRAPTKTVRYQATGPEELIFIDVRSGQVKTLSTSGEGPPVIVWDKNATPLVTQTVRLFVRGKKEYSKEQWKDYEKQIHVNAEPTLESGDK